MKLVIEIEGDTEDDLTVAMEKVVQLLSDGNTSGLGSNESGRFSFTVTGESNEDH